MNLNQKCAVLKISGIVWTWPQSRDRVTHSIEQVNIPTFHVLRTNCKNVGKLLGKGIGLTAALYNSNKLCFLKQRMTILSKSVKLTVAPKFSLTLIAKHFATAPFPCRKSGLHLGSSLIDSYHRKRQTGQY